MSVFVVDASVVVKWFVPEIHSDASRRLLLFPHEYVAPALLFAETANTIWKKIGRKELTGEEGQQLVADIGRIAVETVPCRALAEDAHALANATGRTVYDSMYVALAVRLDTRRDHRGRTTRSCIEKDSRSGGSHPTRSDVRA